MALLALGVDLQAGDEVVTTEHDHPAVVNVWLAQPKRRGLQVAQVLRRFDRSDVRHVYRADNARADAVANEAMDGLR